MLYSMCFFMRSVYCTPPVLFGLGHATQDKMLTQMRELLEASAKEQAAVVAAGLTCLRQDLTTASAVCVEAAEGTCGDAQRALTRLQVGATLA
jgi:hypothetical protein